MPSCGQQIMFVIKKHTCVGSMEELFIIIHKGLTRMLYFWILLKTDFHYPGAREDRVQKLKLNPD